MARPPPHKRPCVSLFCLFNQSKRGGEYIVRSSGGDVWAWSRTGEGRSRLYNNAFNLYIMR